MRRVLAGAAALLLAVGAAPTATATAAVTGDTISRVLVTGRVDLGPTCPVQRPGEDCTDESVDAVVTARRPGHVQRTSAGAAGFRLRLAPGVWRLTANAGMSCDTVRVDLRSGKRPAPIVITCDTGIR